MNMNRNGISIRKKWNKFQFCEKTILCAIAFSCCFSFQTFGRENEDKSISDDQLLDQYVRSKGAYSIVFDQSNIKQFWIDNSVVSHENSFDILLDKSIDSHFESVPLKIVLMNVNKIQDCTLCVVAESNDYSLSILNNNLESVPSSSSNDSFLHYTVTSSVFHMEDVFNSSFCVKINSKTSDKVSIKKIVLSFSNNPNPSFLTSPGFLKFSDHDFNAKGNRDFTEESSEPDSFFAKGKLIALHSKKKILLSDQELSSSITIKNMAKTPTDIYFGYAPYTKAHQNFKGMHTPYSSNDIILTVVSSDPKTNRIVVDNYPKWEKGCFLAINTKEDFSDLPNFSLIDSEITEIKKIDDSHTEILFKEPIHKSLSVGSHVRVHGRDGATFIYTNMKRLAPEEEITFSSKIKYDDSFVKFSSNAFCKGTYFVIPIILSFPANRDDESSILIRNYTISY